MTPTPEVDLADRMSRAPTSPFVRPESEIDAEAAAETEPETEPEAEPEPEPAPAPETEMEPETDAPAVALSRPEIKLPVRGAMAAAVAAGIGLALLVHHDPRPSDVGAGDEGVVVTRLAPSAVGFDEVRAEVEAPPRRLRKRRLRSRRLRPRRMARVAPKPKPKLRSKSRSSFQPTRKRRVRRVESRAAVRARPRPAPKPGFVTVDAQPYATVYIDGRKLGDTPLVRVRLSPGTHRIRGVAADGRVARATVKVVSGRVVRRRLRYRSK